MFCFCKVSHVKHSNGDGWPKPSRIKPCNEIQSHVMKYKVYGHGGLYCYEPKCEAIHPSWIWEWLWYDVMAMVFPLLQRMFNGPMTFLQYSNALFVLDDDFSTGIRVGGLVARNSAGSRKSVGRLSSTTRSREAARSTGNTCPDDSFRFYDFTAKNSFHDLSRVTTPIIAWEVIDIFRSTVLDWKWARKKGEAALAGLRLKTWIRWLKNPVLSSISALKDLRDGSNHTGFWSPHWVNQV